ncbi:hypothetical protein JZX87_08700 [Agrobacterium sp. Ap1]|uniref:hypothetical protein n=1 Tax=Agrobacterium sp. Ap1 TaxID=2815337 RepID=UPI001A8FF92F|nr:hypothetical protein [Agrobacterium sp. Ap1]MBO0141247.1 hypothetical protein [Agrobacterium sp. Ap1]
MADMNFCVYHDIGTEIHGYLVPDGFSSTPVVRVRLNGAEATTDLPTWVYIDGARKQGFHETGNVGFILTDENVPGMSAAPQVELSDPISELVFYRRAQPGQFLPKKVLRVETSIVPHNEIDFALRPRFQFYADRAEHYGFETVRQMLEIIHQPSVYVSGRLMVKNFWTYINYNIEVSMISVQNPYVELAARLAVFSRLRKSGFRFISPRDKVLFKPVVEYFDDIDIQNEQVLNRALASAPKHILALLSSPLTQQLVGSTPSDVAGLNDIPKALDVLSQFDVFDSGNDLASYPKLIADALAISSDDIPMRGASEFILKIAETLRANSRVGHLLEADLILHHFIAKAGTRAEAS